MERSEKIDWLCFSCDGDYDAVKVLEAWALSQGVVLSGTNGSRFYRFGLRGDGIMVSYGNRISSNRFIQVELSGGFFLTPDREQAALDLMEAFRGKPSRLDVAWDFFPGWSLGDNMLQEDLMAIESLWGATKEDRYIEGEWTGATFGYGKGSEVCLRIYDKQREQGQHGYEVVEEKNASGWWRVELMVRGNTLKDQQVEMLSCDQVYDFARGFYRSRYSDPLKIGSDREIQPRKRGVAGIQGSIVYWQRIAEKAAKKLEGLAQEVNPNEVSCRGGAELPGVRGEGLLRPERPWREGECDRSGSGSEKDPWHFGRGGRKDPVSE